MNVKKCFLITGIILFLSIHLFSQVMVKAEIDSEEYDVGDIINVGVSVDNNPGLHTLFFDMEYDESILSFEGKRNSRVFNQSEYSPEILYAQNTLGQGFSTCRIVFSYTLKGYGTGVVSEGPLVELSFRVIGPSVESHSFIFSNCSIIDGDDNEITGVTWQNSSEFTINDEEVTEFILIRDPYENEVFYSDTVSVSLICTGGDDYLATLTNSELPGDPVVYIEVEDGRLLDSPVSIVDGYNVITASLYTADPMGGTDHTFRTLDTVRVYKSLESDFIEIIDPADHSLLNTDMVNVRVKTHFNYVEINGSVADFYGEVHEGAKIFESPVWLKNGFNTITAITHKTNVIYESVASYVAVDWMSDTSAHWTPNELAGMYLEIDEKFVQITGNTVNRMWYSSDPAENEIGHYGGSGGLGTPYRIRSARELDEVPPVVYKDSLQVYYQKDSSIFRFVKPYANQGFKPSEYNKLEILGEIDSQYKTTDDPASGGAVENTVTLKVVYYPSNPAKYPVILADRPAVITESEYGYGMPTSKYVFRNDFDIPLDDLEDGEIEIIAYKNKEGDTWDDKITRIVYIDDERLWIDLVQPNVYTSDVLDTKSKVRKFNETKEIVSDPGGSVLITNQGKITLNTDVPVVRKENIKDAGVILNVDEIVEAPDRTLYALATPSNSSMVIYKKSPADEDWTVFFSRTGIYGYSLCYSPIGLLAGVSNIPTNGQSGLYLVKENELIGFEFGEVNLPHVQFVASEGNTMYLYGSLYHSLYSFNIFDLVEDSGNYRVTGLHEEFFPNNDNIVQFILSNRGRTAMIRTDDPENNIHFYKKSENGFFETILPELNDTSELTGENVIYGPYENSDYICYLVFTSEEGAEVIMQNTSTGRFFRREIVFQDMFASAAAVAVPGAGFKDSEYSFICESGGAYYLTSGEIYFDNYYGDTLAEAQVFEPGEAITKTREELFITSSNNYYLGLKSGESGELYNFYESFAAGSSFGFNYVNDDVDRLSGFSFELDSLWQENGSNGFEYIPGKISFGFSVKEKPAGDDTTGEDEAAFELVSMDIHDLIQQIDESEGNTYSGPNNSFTITRSYNSYTGREIIYVEFSEEYKPDAGNTGYIHFDFTLAALGNTSPGIYALEVFKKIIAKIAGSPGDTIYLPIQGYVHDTTVSDIRIGTSTVPVGRDGSFYNVQTIDAAKPYATITLRCKNVVGDEAELAFTVEIVDSENEVWDVSCNYVSGEDDPGYMDDFIDLVPDTETGSFRFSTNVMEIAVSGAYYGLKGAVCGYKTYSIDDTDFESPLNRGVFEKEENDDLHTSLGLGTGYEAGYFTNQKVSLCPNDQVLVIFVENPGGVRYEYRSEDNRFPVFNYQMPEEDQMVIFEAEYGIDEVINEIQYTHKSVVLAEESDGAPYVFTANSSIKGEVWTIEQLDEVRVVSAAPGVVFENGSHEITASLEPGNKFDIPFRVVMGDDETEKDYHIIVRPTVPVYSFMRRGIVVTVKKDFLHTRFIPDFTETAPESTLEEPLLFLFKENRTDIPLNNSTLATFIVNYSEYSTTGYVDVLDDYYCLRDTETGEILLLENLKTGINRIQWTLHFKDRDKDTGEVRNTILMSSSSFPGMDDVIFTIREDTLPADTIVEFSQPLQNTYYSNSADEFIPDIIITKDPDTDCSLCLNDNIIEEFTNFTEESENGLVTQTYTLTAACIKEGHNSLVITATDKNDSEKVFSYTFLYDSKNPVVDFYSWDVTDNYAVLKELTVIVTEANYNRGYLHYGNGIINAEPDVILLGEDTYLLEWKNLVDPIDYNIRPGTVEAGQAVRVSVMDLAGNPGTTENLSVFTDRERPAEQAIREKEIELPIYNAAIDEETGMAPAGSTDPVPYNEQYYTTRPFRDHTKFAPGIVMGQVDVMDEIDEGEWLVRNLKVQKVVADGELEDSDQFGFFVSVSGDVAVIGAYRDDDAGSNAGAVYIYRWNGTEWLYEDKLIPEYGADTDFAYDSFGWSVSVSGDVAVIGAFRDDDAGTDAGAAYIYRWNGMEWVHEEKLIPEYGTDTDFAGDFFGFLVSVSGDVVFIGAIYDGDAGTDAGAAYIYRWNGMEWVHEEKLIPEYGTDTNFTGDSFGRVSVSGDVAVIGAYQDDDAGTDAGAAYIYRWNGTEWVYEDKLIPEDGADTDFTSDWFGHPVSVSGDVAVIGAYQDDDAGNRAGAAYIYRWNGTEWVYEDKLKPEYGIDTDFADNSFGYSVSVSGDVAVIGAYRDDDAGSNAGAAYIYQWNGTEWVYEDKLIPEYGTDTVFSADSFGRLSVSGDVVIVGATGDDDAGNNAGAAYIYNNLSNTTPDSLDTTFPFDSYSKSYLVFQFQKRATPDMFTIDHIRDRIKFEVSGLKQDLTGSHAVVPVYPLTGVDADNCLTLSEDDDECRYIEGLQYLYYIVETAALQTKFETAAESMWTTPAHTGVIVDRGSLRIIYEDPADDFPPCRVYATGTAGDALDDIIVFDKAYESDTPGDDVPVHDMFQHNPEDCTLTLTEETDELSLSFWLRVEDEGIMDEGFHDADKRVLTFIDDEENGRYYISYQKDDENGLVADLVEVDGETTISWLIGNEIYYPLIAENTAGMRNDTWNHLVLRFTKDDTSGYVKISVNDCNTNTAQISIPLNFYHTIITPGAGFYFGPDYSSGNEEREAGFYSIAHPFYINRYLSDDEIDRITMLYNYTSGGTSEYYFNDAAAEEGVGENDLRFTGNADYAAAEYNAEYDIPDDPPVPFEALKASKSIPNYFLKVPHPRGGYYVILRDADSGVQYNVDSLGRDESFEITLNETAGLGRYYFGNKNSNYGLKPDRWYSISGEVISLEEEALLVMKLNGTEQSMTLKEGEFHFIYDNPDEVTPVNVKIYIETTGDILLSNTLKFNEGNFIVPSGIDNQGYELSAASTTFAFDYSGTVDFWYKPFITNSRGYINYDVVLFDSEYIKIEAAGSGHPESVFRAVIKAPDPLNNIDLTSSIKADYDWHHLQVSYNHESRIVYFYIDGNVAAIYEGSDELPASPTIEGDITGLNEYGDNVFIGCDKDRSVFAEGYLDNVRITKYFYYSRYEDNTPVDISYSVDEEDSTNNRLVLDTPGFDAEDITDEAYRLIATDGTYINNDVTLPFYTSILPAGRYRLVSGMKINGKLYHHYLTFNVDNKPRFDLVDKTPLIFANVSTPVYFAFEYNNSYIYETDILKYAGAAVRINENRTVYLVQDFINQDTSAWLQGTEDGGSISWTPIEKDNGGRLFVTFPGTTVTGSIPCEYEYFYFTDTPDSPEIPVFTGGDPADDTIFLATLTETDIRHKTYEIEEGVTKDFEYMIHVEVAGDASSTSTIYEDIVLEYGIKKKDETRVTGAGEYSLKKQGTGNFYADMYYDDILPDYGEYECTIELTYNDNTYAEESITLTWERLVTENDTDEEKSLKIDEFSLLELDKEKNLVSFYLQIYQNGLDAISGEIAVKQEFDITVYPVTGITTTSTTWFTFIENIEIPKGNFTVTAKIEADGFIRTRVLELANFAEAPDIVLTNYVESVISYNDVYFSWKGYLDGAFDESIEYRYDFDGSNWGSWSREWRDVRFYNLSEGTHSFKVQARNPNGNIESVPGQVSFFVDINKPVFDPSLITVEKLYDSMGIITGAAIRGEEGAVSDISLRYMAVDSGREVTIGENGSFMVSGIVVTKDGITPVTLTAVDRVGNYTDYTIHVENYITQIDFPDVTEYVKYSPLTITGTINQDITAGVDIYVRDPFCGEDNDGSFKTWKKGTINQDRTFFVENIFVNPGTSDQGIITTLILATVFENNRVFERELEIWANEIILPIELTLSRHSAEGENADTEVTITAYANVDNISSWSVDFDGDGIYDVIDMVDIPADPGDESGKTATWEHTYSSIGLVHPRVRVITTDGNFFSVSDTLIIHEKIKEVSHKMIDTPISMDSVRMPDDSERIFLLKGMDENTAIDVYEVARNENYISNKLYTINLYALGIEGAEIEEDIGITGPVCIRIIDKDHLIVGVNTGTAGMIYELTTNEFDNYIIEQVIEVSGFVHDITLDDYHLYISYLNRNYFTTIGLENGIMDDTSIEDAVPDAENTLPIGENSGIAKDSMGLLVADFFNQRVVRLTNGLKMHEQFGSIGDEEKEFLTPSIITSYKNRIFVFDKTRGDIQVFDLQYTPVCILEYDEYSDFNYMESTFFNDIRAISVMSRVENNMLYYYALIMSKSAGKLALLRLPQWEELRARVRNNKIVFIDDGEVFTAKPDGSDLRKILCTDSIPRVEGALNYPSLSPDGKKLVFTSRLDLYIGAYDEVQSAGNECAYDHIYVYKIEEKTLSRLYLGDYEGYEIERPVFNSNGDTLIFSAKETGEQWQIYTCSFDSGVTDRLFSSNENARFPYYSPEDDYIVFTTDYDGDEDIAIIGVDNPDIRIDVTNNNVRDTFPVWSRTYPDEEDSADYVDSKIAYIAERAPYYQKGVYYVYVQHIPEFGINIVDTAGQNVGNDPDSAAVLITTDTEEGDYPCFTGDGKNLVFEQYNGEVQKLRNYDFIERSAYPDNITDMDLPEGAERPAGMKNMITNFKAENTAGNQVKLTWDRYTDKDICYVLEIDDENDDQHSMNRDVLSQEGTVVAGLQTGTDYRFRVYISENEEEVATSRVEYVTIPVVTAIPSYEIDEENPYVVHLHAWKPADESGNTWRFAWIINNSEILVQNSRDYSYEYSTSGRKTIQLKVYDSLDVNNATNYDISDPFYVDIVSDIAPVIEYVLAEDSRYVDLTCENSLGYNIDYANAVWYLTGPDGPPVQLTGPSCTADISAFTRKVTVNLTLPRIQVTGQQGTDAIVKTRIIDLDYTDLKPVITCEEHESKERLFKFSGQESMGNIDWYRARWNIFADNSVIYQTEGVSTFEYQFPERNSDTIYSVSLTIPRRGDGMTDTISQIISVEAAPIEPMIDYKIISLTRDGEVTGQKIIFDCTKSTGSGIEFSQARWSVPMASDYGNQAVQTGPTATYNLVGIDEGVAIEAALTLSRAGGTDAKTIIQLINVVSGEIPAKKLKVNCNTETSSTGKVLILDVLDSTGPNIDWERTEWLIDSQYTRKGPVTRYDVPASPEETIVNYTCVLYRYGSEPETETGEVSIDKTAIEPVITPVRKSVTQPNVYELSVLDTKGVNIDWDKTRWYIYDGNQEVTVKQGAVIYHAFVLDSEKMGYPVMVEIFLKGDTKPFVGYRTIDVGGDELIPIITTFRESEEDPAKIMLSAETSQGSGIDWTQTKWTFLDSAEVAYGPVISHTFPRHSGGDNKTYTVALTLYRRQANGSVESKTGTKEIETGKDEIVPKIKALVIDDYLVLSAEKSEGFGLLLDRCVWVFPGKGDNVTYNENYKEGTLWSNNFTVGGSAQGKLGYKGYTGVKFDGFVLEMSSGTYYDVFVEGHVSDDLNAISYWGDFKDKSDSFSSSNYHTGPICRRYVKDLDTQIVTLMVYRMTTDGGVEGKSITVNINLNNIGNGAAGASVDSEGVVYE